MKPISLRSLNPWRKQPGEEQENRTALDVSAIVADDERGWSRYGWRAQDYDPSQMQEIYLDALTAWRKNPIAWRIIAITTDYVVGDELRVSSPIRGLDRFITRFWHHPKNQMDLRLQPMSDELARSGDLFILLFRNPQDGMSYIRFVTKDRIGAIQTAENDWETELSFCERCDDGSERLWLSPQHPQADQAQAVMLHYAVNRPLGALLGESDLTTMIPWLQRYSRMLEDRVRLHWAVRAFLWLVTVPANKVKEKQEQYRIPPEAGSIVVHDEIGELAGGSAELARRGRRCRPESGARHDRCRFRLPAALARRSCRRQPGDCHRHAGAHRAAFAAQTAVLYLFAARFALPRLLALEPLGPPQPGLPAALYRGPTGYLAGG